jgi:hypothetical protein
LSCIAPGSESSPLDSGSARLLWVRVEWFGGDSGEVGTPLPGYASGMGCPMAVHAHSGARGLPGGSRLNHEWLPKSNKKHLTIRRHGQNNWLEAGYSKQPATREHARQTLPPWSVCRSALMIPSNLHESVDVKRRDSLRLASERSRDLFGRTRACC